MTVVRGVTQGDKFMRSLLLKVMIDCSLPLLKSLALMGFRGGIVIESVCKANNWLVDRRNRLMKTNLSEGPAERIRII